MNMKTLALSLLSGGAFLAFAAGANAAPLQLNDGQMDGVTAGATSIVVGLGGAFGTLSAGNISTAIAQVMGANALASASNTSIGASFNPGPSASAISELAAVLTSP
jgi:hypothetical protein